MSVPTEEAAMIHGKRRVPVVTIRPAVSAGTDMTLSRRFLPASRYTQMAVSFKRAAPKTGVVRRGSLLGKTKSRYFAGRRISNGGVTQACSSQMTVDEFLDCRADRKSVV